MNKRGEAAGLALYGHCRNYRADITEDMCRRYRQGCAAWNPYGAAVRLNKECRACPGLDMSAPKVLSSHTGRLIPFEGR